MGNYSHDTISVSENVCSDSTIPGGPRWADRKAEGDRGRPNTTGGCRSIAFNIEIELDMNPLQLYCKSSILMKNRHAVQSVCVCVVLCSLDCH